MQISSRVLGLWAVRFSAPSNIFVSEELVLIKRPARLGEENEPPVEGTSFSTGRILLICGAVALGLTLVVICVILVKKGAAFGKKQH